MIIKNDPPTIQSYLEDSSNLAGGHCEAVYLPETESDIRKIIKEAAQKKTSLTISGAGTGTVGGRIPFGGSVISTEKLPQVIEIDPKNKTATFKPGITIKDIDEALKPCGLMYAPDPTEKTAFLGGTVATNASGARSMRYGSTRRHINRIKVMLSTGETVNIKRDEKASFPIPDLAPKVKSSSGYYMKSDADLIDLFIGSEGTLGIISEIEVSLIDRFNKTFDCIAFFETEDQAVRFAHDLIPQSDITCLEYFDANSLDLLRSKYPKIPSDIKTALYFEQLLNEEANLDFWEGFFNRHNSKLELAWPAMNEKKAEELWEFRHALPEQITDLFKKYREQKISLDIAVPQSNFKAMLDFYNSVLEESKIFYIKFGHIGESHLHVNILPKTDDEKIKANGLIMPFIKKGISLGGSVSAEHGIGKIKHPYLLEMYGQSGINAMIDIKKRFDPALIFGLGNIFPKHLLT